MTGSDEETPLAEAISALTLRNIGPAFMGGRIADVAVNHERPTTWYVAVGSGGLWRTDNAGTTWKPVFDEQPSFSIGCVELDPITPDTIWVGTGEAVSGRHVAWGDGVYRSIDGGATWRRMGLERSEHIGRIAIDPNDPDVVWVAAEGPLWSSGGDRGLFRTEDGGETWEQVLDPDADPDPALDPDDAVTGATCVVLAPDDPDTVYAATYQRHRNVHSFVGGGPGSGIHVSRDGGETWDRVSEGLPEGDLGKIGLAVTPADPDVVYATIEAVEEPLTGRGGHHGDRRGESSTGGPDGKPRSGFYRSTTRGQTWERRSGYLSGGTGPHYYQEIFASPLDADKVFQVDVFLHHTTDGGKTFRNLEERCGQKHADNHVVWIDPDPVHGGRHLLVGTDGGLYETWDEGHSWRHFSNLPIAQFYRVAVDSSVPFTNVLGGAQDLGTLAGPLRTTTTEGVRNQDWWVPLGADGYHCAFDPDDPDITYLSWQEGNVMRQDRRTMELIDIKPIPGGDGPEGDTPERWNWDTPVVISPHGANRIYVASQRVWRSDDRGDSWTAISGDLTLGRNRYELPTGGRVWSIDALHDPLAMSVHGTITDVSESPLAEGVLYAGTDDGLVQVTEDGGRTWRRAGELPDLPSRSDGSALYVNDVEAARDDPDGVFVLADDHKSGDYTPHLYESTDRGRTWRSIRGDLPAGSIPWSLEQDSANPDLLFLAAETGLFASLDRGQHWHRLGGKSVPTISFRDLALQRRDDDLVGASFGRGMYVLDDIGPLRTLSEEVVAEGATLFPVRPAWRYQPHDVAQATGQPTLGSTAFTAPNPPFGATFTYHLAEGLADGLRTAAQRRRDGEKPLEDEGADVAFPGWEALRAERLEPDPVVQLVVRDAGGEAVRTLAAERKAGLHRTSWDLRHPAPAPVDLTDPGFRPPWVDDPIGPLVPAGRYSVELVRVAGGTVEVLAGPESFDVVDTPAVAAAGAGLADGAAPTTETSGAADAHEAADADAYERSLLDLARRVSGSAEHVEQLRYRLRHLRAGLATTPAAGPDLFDRLDRCHHRLEAVSERLSGDPVRAELGEPTSPSIGELVGRASNLHWYTTAQPTATQRGAVERATAAHEALATDLDALTTEVAELTADVDRAGGPWTPR